MLSLYPGMVRTEAVLKAAEGGWLDLANSESPEFIGRVIVGLASDPSTAARSGSVVVAAAEALRLIFAGEKGPQLFDCAIDAYVFYAPFLEILNAGMETEAKPSRPRRRR